VFFLRRYASVPAQNGNVGFGRPLDARAVFVRSISNEVQCSFIIEDSLDFMNETICHVAPLINYMFMSSMMLS
jgi:hypothetical protein